MTTAMAFIDFETTGLDTDCLLLEVAWVVTSPDLVDNHQVRHRFLWHGAVGADEVWTHCHPIALEMHKTSGLYGEWHEWAAPHRARGWGSPRRHEACWLNLAEVDREMATDIKCAAAALGADKIMLAGSGIGPFDVPLVRRHLPLTAAAVHYRPLDISSVREMGRLVGLAPPWPDDQRPHRAVPDVEWSLRDARWWRTTMGTAARLKGAA